MAKKKKAKRGPRISRFVLNCVASSGTDQDWQFGDAAGANLINLDDAPPNAVDLREDWWTISDQGTSGACVGYATADGVLRWLYVKEKMLNETEKPSVRFIWMANKETDDLRAYPTSFLDSAGTSTKLALKVAKKYGCVPHERLPMKGKLSNMNPTVFFSIAAQYRISAYFNLYAGSSDKISALKLWIAQHGPVLSRLDVDDAFKKASKTDGRLETYDPGDKKEGHAVCLVGYTPAHFIVRNSWGEKWGDKGFAYASYAYAEAAFDEAYGAIMNRLDLVR